MGADIAAGRGIECRSGNRILDSIGRTGFLAIGVTDLGGLGSNRAAFSYLKGTAVCRVLTIADLIADVGTIGSGDGHSLCLVILAASRRDDRSLKLRQVDDILGRSCQARVPTVL